MKTLHLSLSVIQKRMLAGLYLLALFSVLIVQPVRAIASGYATDDQDLKPGMVAALSNAGTADNPKVERASTENDTKIIGVTTTPEDQLVSIVSGGQEVYVQTTGEVDAYTSDINGEVKNGDLLALSPLRGVLMKAGDSKATIVGVALEDFDGTAAETKSIQDNGRSREVKIERLKINLDHKAPSNQQADITDSSLERLGRSITGRNVGELRVIAAMIIFLIVLVAEGGIIYGAISSAITALGRNPMARKIIQREVSRVLMVAILVLVIGLGAIYLILWI